MVRLAWAPICGALICLRFMSGVAQECPDSSPPASTLLGKTYAPVLRFGPGERYFPTVPFFAAFDTVGRGSGLLDKARISPTSSRTPSSPQDTTTPLISWNALDSTYLTRVVEIRPLLYLPKSSAVFYRVRCLEGKQNKQLWGFLKNDPQAWHRTGLDSLFACGLRDARFTLIEYWLYYVRDAGLEGHPHDTERVDVFLPRRFKAGIDPESARCRSLTLRSMLDSMRIVVGTGHTETTPNNVLVLLGQSAYRFANPGVLVELGGHASAPDRNWDAEFQLGLDVNWNIGERVWGTRDVQAVSGTGYIGRYTSAMTLPRPPDLSTTLIPDTLSQEVRDSAKPGDLSTRRYALLPLAPFEKLARYLEGSTTVSACDAAVQGDSAFQRVAGDSARDVIRDSIVPLLSNTWKSPGFGDASPAEVDSAIGWMKSWVRPQLRDGKTVSAAKDQIWRHPSFCTSPIEVLKRRLYRPTGTGIQNAGDVFTLFTFNFGATLGDGGQQFQVGFMLPTIKSKLVIPGILEPQIGIYSARFFRGGPRTASFSLLYERQYRNTFSWYVRPINYVHDRARYDLDPDAGDFAMGFGISVMPFFPFPNFLFKTADQLRLRAGIRVDMRKWKPDPRRLELQSTFYLR